jgi:hypothetical protein
MSKFADESLTYGKISNFQGFKHTNPSKDTDNELQIIRHIQNQFFTVYLKYEDITFFTLLYRSVLVLHNWYAVKVLCGINFILLLHRNWKHPRKYERLPIISPN